MTLKTRLTEIMLSNNDYPASAFASILKSMAFVYGGVVRIRRRLYEKRVLATKMLPCPVISVGNLTVGGTGKTPMVMRLATMIRDLGLRAAIVSRGYKGEAQKRGTVVSDGCSLLCNARTSGDEPYLMASLLSGTPVAVGIDRYAAGMIVFERFAPDIILLDDAYQHLGLHRDLNLLLMDACRPFGNSYLLPRGSLREPISALAAADAVVITRYNQTHEPQFEQIKRLVHPEPVFRSVHRVVLRGMAPAGMSLPPVAELSRVPTNQESMGAYCFSGLANNGGFFTAMEQIGFSVRGTMAFDDHHRYGEADLRRITKAAAESGADCLITTDKDYVRLPGRRGFPMALVVAGITLEFPSNELEWKSYLTACIQRLMDKRKAAG